MEITLESIISLIGLMIDSNVISIFLKFVLIRCRL